MRAEVGAGELPHLLLQLVQGRRHRAVLGHAVGGRDEAVHPVPEGHGAEPQLGLADFGPTAASVSGSTVNSTSPSSVSTLVGSPGKPTPSSLRTVLRPPSQPTR
jgi:hypothetical protein